MHLLPLLPFLLSLPTLTLAKDNPYTLWRRYNHHHHLGMNCTARAAEPGQVCLDENGKLTTKQTEATLVPPLGPRWGEKPKDRTGVELLSLYEKGEKGEQGKRVGTWGVWVNKGEDEEGKKKGEEEMVENGATGYDYHVDLRNDIGDHLYDYDAELEKDLQKHVKESPEFWAKLEGVKAEKEKAEKEKEEVEKDEEETAGDDAVTTYSKDAKSSKKLEKYRSIYDTELEEALEKSIKESEAHWRQQHKQEPKQKEAEAEVEAKQDQEDTAGDNFATGYELKEKPKKYQTDRDRQWTRAGEEFWTREWIFPRVRGRRQRGRSCI